MTHNHFRGQLKPANRSTINSTPFRGMHPHRYHCSPQDSNGILLNFWIRRQYCQPVYDGRAISMRSNGSGWSPVFISFQQCDAAPSGSSAKKTYGRPALCLMPISQADAVLRNHSLWTLRKAAATIHKKVHVSTGTFIAMLLSTSAECFENAVRQRFEERIRHNKFTLGCTDPRLSHWRISITGQQCLAPSKLYQVARQMGFRPLPIDSLHTHIVNLKRNKVKSSISLIQNTCPSSPRASAIRRCGTSARLHFEAL